MHLINAEKVADAWKSAGRKHKDKAEKLMMSGNAEDFSKGVIMATCAEMLIETADSLLKDVPSDPIHEAFFEWRNPETDPPKVETEVLVLVDCGKGYCITTAFYEDGTVSQYESLWQWEDVDDYGIYDEEEDLYRLPKGWWEYRHFTPEDALECPIGKPVVGWMPLPPKEVKQ